MSVNLANLQKVGYGLMNFTWIASRKFSQEEFNVALKRVIDGSGATATNPLVLNSGEFYGIPKRHESLELLGGFFQQHEDYADKVFLSIKGGVNPKWAPDTSAKNLNETFKAIEKYLKPLYNARKERSQKLDMFCLCRVGAEPIEDTMEILVEKAEQGLFDTLCLSEVSTSTLTRAQTVGKVDAVEVEFSLFHREPVENSLFAACVESDILAVAYSPLGKGLLAGQRPSDLKKDDMRNQFDKFKDPDVIANNDKLISKLSSLAKAKNLTPPQLALSWITSLSNKQRNGFEYPQIVPIPGSTNAERQLNNLNVVDLSEETLDEIDDFLKTFKTAGHRYNKILDKATYL